jgi:peptidoglycan/LPS O-acetylase OafA/YrhL
LHLKESKTLAAASIGRDNNLNLLRVIAALLVLFSHCFTLTSGNSATEPGRAHLGLTLGDFSVDIFFVMSGFLVAKSLARSQSLRHYAMARGFRIFPGLWVALALTTATVCICYSTASPIDNLVDPSVWFYLFKNAIVVTGPVFGFDGAFAYNPYPWMVNASLWTLPLELWMYILLACAWAATQLTSRNPPAHFQYAVRAIAVVMTVATLVLDATGHTSNSLRHASVFFIAAGLLGVEDRVRLRPAVFAAMLATVVLAALFLPVAFEPAYRLLLPYLVLFVAFVPNGFIRRYNRLGDYSYGIYIYAFPVQQMVEDSIPGISVLNMFLLSAALTLACAVGSWHLVEKRAMNWRARWDKRSAGH